MKITSVRARDIRFPTSRDLDGSDSLNVGDYSATYVTLETDEGARRPRPDLHERPRQRDRRGRRRARWRPRGRGPHPRGDHRATCAASTARLTQDPQLRWIGPEKGILHMATGAVVNAIWDLWAQAGRGKPLWKLLADLTPASRSCPRIDFMWITDALTPDEALEILREERRRRKAGARGRDAARTASRPTPPRPAGSATPDEKVRRLCREAMAAGLDPLQDEGRPGPRGQPAPGRAHARGDRPRAAADAWTRTSAGTCREAIRQMKALAALRPLLDRGAHQPRRRARPRRHRASAIAPIRVATGEACQNRVIFKQLLQAGAIGVLPGRLLPGGRRQRGAVDPAHGHEVRRAGLPARRAASGLCEYVQHLAIFDYIAVERHRSRTASASSWTTCTSTSWTRCVIENARYVCPDRVPATASTMKPESLDDYEFPGGAAWNRPAPDADPARIGQLPLGDLRAALLRDHDQLHRPPDHRHPEARAAERHRLERDRVLEHRARLPARLRDRPGPGLGGCIDRIGHPARLRRSPSCWWSLAAMGHAPSRAQPSSGFGVARFAPRPGRGRQLPRLDQDRGRVVPQEGARASPPASSTPGRTWGPSSRRSSSPGSSLHLGLAGRVRGHRRHRVRLALRLVRALPARPRSIRAFRRPSSRYIRSDPAEPPARDALGAAPAPPPDLGLRPRQVPDRPRLVVLPLLDPRLPPEGATASTSRRAGCPWSSST